MMNTNRHRAYIATGSPSPDHPYGTYLLNVHNYNTHNTDKAFTFEFGNNDTPDVKALFTPNHNQREPIFNTIRDPPTDKTTFRCKTTAPTSIPETEYTFVISRNDHPSQYDNHGITLSIKHFVPDEVCAHLELTPKQTTDLHDFLLAGPYNGEFEDQITTLVAPDGTTTPVDTYQLFDHPDRFIPK